MQTKEALEMDALRQPAWRAGTPVFHSRFGLGDVEIDRGATVLVRFGLQYTMYDTFDGASSNYDGTGRNASDNNTLFVYAWVAY